MIGIEDLQHLVNALAQLDLGPVAHDELGKQADLLANAVRQSLSHAPGSDHATPWLRTGELRDSITATAEADAAIVGSASPVAVYQEHGTVTVPPRPFLAPAGAAGGEAAANGVGRAIADAIHGALR